MKLYFWDVVWLRTPFQNQVFRVTDKRMEDNERVSIAVRCIAAYGTPAIHTPPF